MDQTKTDKQTKNKQAKLKTTTQQKNFKKTIAQRQGYSKSCFPS